MSGAALSLFTCFDGSYIFTNQKLTFYNNVDTYLIKNPTIFTILTYYVIKLYSTSLHFLYIFGFTITWVWGVLEKWLGHKFDFKFANTLFGVYCDILKNIF